jgi:hypothetical protein
VDVWLRTQMARHPRSIDEIQKPEKQDEIQKKLEKG